ncbi:hypothetical protein BGZ96_007080 [Linnemannia gamsii]|uniref:Uncharacterized protein n=1 Tax=Linnemannia gamsii TaxID=64522 RepID=A0ABQ7K162_9FUNG|nr:hypothetical protein BGZ96_007080 [Linnemannia gamsii]
MPPPKWKTEIVPSHKFEFINIADFHSNSPWTRLRYMWVWTMFFKAILVLCGDVWTCTILIISGAWTSEIKPTIDISIARWVFTGCILLSFLLLATDFRKANKVIKSDDISYAVSNTIVSGFYCLQKYDYFCFIERIRNSSKLHDKLSFFVFFQLKGWKHLVVQAPRAVINIMTLVAFMQALGFDLDHLDEVSQILPNLKLADKFTFCVMVFTSLMFIFSGLATLAAIILWIPLVAKVQGNLKEYVCHKMDKRIDNIIKKSTKERARRNRRQQELEDKRYIESLGRGGGNGSGGDGGDGNAGVGTGSSGFRRGGLPMSAKAPSFGGSTPRRPKPTLPDIDVILANAHEDMRLPSNARISQQQQRPQHTDQNPYHPHHVNLHQQHRQHHHHASHPYNHQHNQYAYHESPPFATTSPYSGTRRSLSSGGRAAGMGYHGPSQHHVQTYQYHHSPPKRFHETPNRKQSLASAHSEGSPVMYNRSLSAGGTGPPLSKAAQIARYYLEQQQYQQSLQQRQQSQSAWLSQPPTGSSPQHQHQNQPLQSQNYHDTRRHTPILMRAVSDGPEHWPAHYGFAADASQTATPSTVEQFSIYRPDSGVLPDQNDPYYKQFAAQKSEHNYNLHQHDDSVEGSASGSRSNEKNGQQSGGENSEAVGKQTAMDRRGSSGSAKAILVYQPDKTELEQYDNLYKGITETHLRVKATRTLSVRSLSSKASLLSSSPEPSYARALRQQQQQLLLDHKTGYSQVDDIVKQQQQQQQEHSSGDNDSGAHNHGLPQVTYIQPPPPVLSQYYASPSSSSLTTLSTSHHPRLVHHASIPNLHHHQQQQQHHLHNSHSSSSLRSSYTTTSASSSYLPLTMRASSDQLRETQRATSTTAHPLTRDFHGKEEHFSQHGFPVVLPPSSLPLGQRNTVSSFESEPKTPLAIEDVLHDLATSLLHPQNGRGSPLPPPPSTVPPPSPVPSTTTAGVGSVRSPSKVGSPIRSRTPVNNATPPLPPPHPLQPAPAPPMSSSTARISTATFVSGRDLYSHSPPGVDDNVKVEVFEDINTNIKVEVRNNFGEEEEEGGEIKIKDVPRSITVAIPASVHVQEVAVASIVSTPPHKGEGFTTVAEDEEEPMAKLDADDDGDGDDGCSGHNMEEWEEDQKSATVVGPILAVRLSTDQPPLLPSCPPPNFHPQEAESLILQQSPKLQQQQLRWSVIKQQQQQYQQSRLSTESRRDNTGNSTTTANDNYNPYQDLHRVVDSPEPESESESEKDKEPETLMYLRTSNTSKSSLASTNSTRYYLQHHSFPNRSGTTPMPPRTNSPPPPVPSITASTSTTNLASALRKGMVSSNSHSGGDYIQSRASIDQVRTSVERAIASASASPRIESKLRMSTDRPRS